MTVATMTAPPAGPALTSRSSESFRTWMRNALSDLEFQRRQITFLLGTDEFIHHERRAAFTPRHVAALHHDLAAIGLEPRIFAVAGTGERARNEAGDNFTDDAYAAAGAEVVSAADTPGLGRLDVVHALKEPTEYESDLEGPMLRIGALHLASKPPGLCHMLGRRNFAAILDGGTIGNCSYLAHGGDRTPIVGSMSRFAGAVSGLKVVRGLERGGLDAGTIIVVGAGIAGMSAIEKVKPKAARLIVVEPYAPTAERVQAELETMGFDDFEIIPQLFDEVFEGARGIVFAHRSGAKAAEKVCSYDQIRRMQHGAVIADIAIDQGGSILHAGYSEQDNATISRDKYRALLTPEYVYYAETNMPREEPWEASEMHGDSSLPYVTALLALVAHLGSTEAVSRRLLEHQIRIFDPAEELPQHSAIDYIAQDLRNGVQLAVADGELSITDPDIERNVALRQWIRACADS
ncbi:MAG: hypothetical protein AAF560_15480 [Acidobacteriota bacterium]